MNMIINLLRKYIVIADMKLRRIIELIQIDSDIIKWLN